MNKPSRKRKKNLSYFSHEYIIANHSDIVSFVVMLVVMALLFKTTAPVASHFVMVQHAITVNDTANNEIVKYENGKFDFLNVLFYALVAIIFHAIIQEYVLDKLNKKLHLSKTKYSKFNESGQLGVFYLLSIGWGIHLLINGQIVTNLQDLWNNYPHAASIFWLKLYFICQISYWVHQFPELYFQKIKKEETPSRIIYSSMYLCFIIIGYALNFTRLTVCLLTLHYIIEFIFHSARLLYFAGKSNFATIWFVFWDLCFVVVRVLSATLAYLTFMHGLSKTSVDYVIWADGNFNTKTIRYNCLLFVILVQAYMMWNFINFHMRRFRVSKNTKKVTTSFVTNTDLQKKKKGKRDDDDINELPEADQVHQKELKMKMKLKLKST